MPRTARAIVAGFCYHVINRGNNKAQIFHEDADYAAFIGLMAAAQRKYPLALLGACLMPNHIHLVVQPDHDRAVTRWMHWLLTSHVGIHARKYQTVGRVWQGRFKASAIQRDEHLLRVLRYVERNAMRAELCERAEDWRWGSLNWRSRDPAVFALQPSPVALPKDWIRLVNAPQTAEELEAIRGSINRQRPIGSKSWIKCAAQALEMESSITESGRPIRRNR